MAPVGGHGMAILRKVPLFPQNKVQHHNLIDWRTCTPLGYVSTCAPLGYVGYRSIDCPWPEARVIKMEQWNLPLQRWEWQTTSQLHVQMSTCKLVTFFVLLSAVSVYNATTVLVLICTRICHILLLLCCCGMWDNHLLLMTLMIIFHNMCKKGWTFVFYTYIKVKIEMTSGKWSVMTVNK